MSTRRVRRVLRRGPGISLLLGITAGVLLIVSGLWCWAEYLDLTVHGAAAANSSLLGVVSLALFAVQAARPRRRRQR